MVSHQNGIAIYRHSKLAKKSLKSQRKSFVKATPQPIFLLIKQRLKMHMVCNTNRFELNKRCNSLLKRQYFLLLKAQINFNFCRGARCNIERLYVAKIPSQIIDQFYRLLQASFTMLRYLAERLPSAAKSDLSSSAMLRAKHVLQLMLQFRVEQFAHFGGFAILAASHPLSLSYF